MESCPLCGGAQCPRYLGVYYRSVVDEGGTYYKKYPIARFLCRKKGKKRSKHVTFSLMPSGLIPYVKYSLVFVVKAMNLIHMEKKTIKEVLDYLSGLDGSIMLNITSKELYIFRDYIISCIDKIIIMGYKGLNSKLKEIDSADSRIKWFLSYLEGKTDGKADYADEVSYDFYESLGGYKTNSFFLFGIPSQFRPG
jgi:hypothetical protein